MVRTAVCVVAIAAMSCTGMAQTVANGPGATGSRDTGLGVQIQAMVAEPAVARAHWGVVVTTLDGTPIYGLNEGQLFQPASTAKLFSTTMAMAMLGEDERFETQAVASGEIDKQGVLHGDLKLVGGGDPSFGTQDLP